MPTIDELPQAVSVSDSDELVVSQSDIARSASRAQLLSGVQAALAVPSGSLLGRLSAGTGAPETIAIGANLTAGNGTLSAPAPFLIDALSTGGNPMPTDQVAIGQGGQNAALSYATFMAGISTLPGINGTNISATALGGTIARPLMDFLADALSIESFGAVGDGVTDDTAAFVAAAASGRPFRLDARTYIVNGPLTLAAATAIIGVPGSTIIRRTSLVESPTWIDVTAGPLVVDGVTFDAGGLAGADMAAVTIGAACSGATLVRSSFINAVGTKSGCGLSISSGFGAAYQIEQCQFRTNALHGLNVTGSGTVLVEGCSADNNTGCGISVQSGVSCILRANSCASNAIGLSVGNWSIGAAPESAASTCLVANNLVSNNSDWGLAIAAVGALIDGNSLQNNGTGVIGGGLIGRLGASRVSNTVVAGGASGIDARGSWGSVIAGCHVSGTGTAILCGGSQNVTVNGNVLLMNGWGVVVSAIEPSLSAIPTGPLTVHGNWIGFTTAQGGGVRVQDGAQEIAITGNDLNGWGSAIINQAVWLHTDAAVLGGNHWNNQARFSVQANPVANLEALVVPDIAEDVLVTAAPAPIASILTSHQADTLGQVTFIKVTSGGSGYTQAQISIGGSGSGAAASAVVNNGAVVWIIVTNAGSGYGTIGSSAPITITGDGSGAAATAYVGLPVLEGRRLRLVCNCQLQFTLLGASPPQQSWTGYQSTVPAFAVMELEGVFGAWRAVAFPPVDYLAPTGDGGAILQSAGSGDLVLRPASGGALHFTSAAESIGCTSTVGRGSPLGVVAAPPGSDFRNLNGGTGTTFWIKQANNDATGWAAIG
jgi:parallel beta-helix repeat protein